MTHYAGHRRDAFLKWLDQGMPAVATMERNYEEIELPREEFVWDFLECSDTMPREYREPLAALLDVSEWRVGSYGAAAHELLARVEDELLRSDAASWAEPNAVNPEQTSNAQPKAFRVRYKASSPTRDSGETFRVQREGGES